VFLTLQASADGAGTKRHLRELDLNAPLAPGAEPGVTTDPALEPAVFFKLSSLQDAAVPSCLLFKTLLSEDRAMRQAARASAHA
jgi:hypothetical protein